MEASPALITGFFTIMGMVVTAFVTGSEGYFARRREYDGSVRTVLMVLLEARSTFPQVEILLEALERAAKHDEQSNLEDVDLLMGQIVILIEAAISGGRRNRDAYARALEVIAKRDLFFSFRAQSIDPNCSFITSILKCWQTVDAGDQDTSQHSELEKRELVLLKISPTLLAMRKMSRKLDELLRYTGDMLSDTKWRTKPFVDEYIKPEYSSDALRELVDALPKIKQEWARSFLGISEKETTSITKP